MWRIKGDGNLYFLQREEEEDRPVGGRFIAERKTGANVNAFSVGGKGYLTSLGREKRGDGSEIE